jgi:DNA-binding NarL/FixJ family response regulator
MSKIRLLLLDDHVLFREGLNRLLTTEDDFQIVAHCGLLSEALNLIAKQVVDIVLLDFDLGDDTGMKFLSAAKTAGFSGKVLLVTAGISPVDSSLVWQQGISGIFLKHGSPATLLEAIRAVAEGRKWLDPNVEPQPAPASVSVELEARGLLTHREQQVLRCVFEGLINKQIAARIGISQSSVKATLQRLFEKTGVRTRSQLVRFAIERSLENGERGSQAP